MTRACGAISRVARKGDTSTLPKGLELLFDHERLCSIEEFKSGMGGL